MLIKWYVLLSFLQLSYGLATCPEECTCSMDFKGRLQTVCSKGGLRAIPVKALDRNVEVLVIVGPKNYVSISPIFIPFTKLEVLRINDANVQSIGVHSFWGVQSLRVLGMCPSPPRPHTSTKLHKLIYCLEFTIADLSRNNISSILATNFRGQDGLHELNLSHNKIQEMPSWTFQHLKVSNEQPSWTFIWFFCVCVALVPYVSECGSFISQIIFLARLIGSATIEFGWQFDSGIGAPSLLHAGQIESFGSERKSIDWFAARCLQGYFGKRMPIAKWHRINRVYNGMWNLNFVFRHRNCVSWNVAIAISRKSICKCTIFCSVWKHWILAKIRYNIQCSNATQNFCYQIDCHSSFSRPRMSTVETGWVRRTRFHIFVSFFPLADEIYGKGRVQRFEICEKY